MTMKRLAELDPNQVLDAAIRQLDLKNDAALARHLSLRPPVISKIRHCTIPIGASTVLRILEATDLNLPKLVDIAEREERISHKSRREKYSRYIRPAGS